MTVAVELGGLYLKETTEALVLEEGVDDADLGDLAQLEVGFRLGELDQLLHHNLDL